MTVSLSFHLLVSETLMQTTKSLASLGHLSHLSQITAFSPSYQLSKGSQISLMESLVSAFTTFCKQLHPFRDLLPKQAETSVLKSREAHC